MIPLFPAASICPPVAPSLPPHVRALQYVTGSLGSKDPSVDPGFSSAESSVAGIIRQTGAPVTADCSTCDLHIKTRRQIPSHLKKASTFGAYPSPRAAASSRPSTFCYYFYRTLCSHPVDMAEGLPCTEIPVLKGFLGLYLILASPLSPQSYTGLASRHPRLASRHPRLAFSPRRSRRALELWKEAKQANVWCPVRMYKTHPHGE